MDEVKFECGFYENCNRKPFAMIYPYIKKKTIDGKNAEFVGWWDYVCLWHFIILKIFEKLRLTKYKFAWSSPERCDKEW